MSKFSLTKWLKKQGKIRLFTQQSNTDTTSTGSSQPVSILASQLPLYDTPSLLNVELFYRIMETRDLSLLLINPNHELPESEAINLLTRLNNTWLELQEFYYGETNKQKFEQFKGNLKKVIRLETELLACKAALTLVEYGEDSGYETLKHFNIHYTEPKKIRGAILRRETKLDFARGDLERKSAKTDQKEAMSFCDMVVGVEMQLNRQLNVAEMSLERWVAYLKQIRQKNEAENKISAARKSKRKQKA